MKFKKGTSSREMTSISNAAVAWTDNEEKELMKCLQGEDMAGNKKGSKKYNPHLLPCNSVMAAFVAGVYWEQARAARKAKRKGKT